MSNQDSIRMREVSIAAYGVLPDSGIDCTDAVQAAIMELSSGNAPWRLRFPKGRYDFKRNEAVTELNALLSGALHPDTKWGRPDLPYHRALLISDAQDFEIDGQGSTFVFHGLVQPFEFQNCHRFNLRGISIEWDRPLFSNGKVLSVTQDVVTVEMDEQFPLVGGEPVWFVMSYDRFTRRFGRAAGYGAAAPLVHVRNRVYVFAARGFQDFHPGIGINIRHLNNYRPGIYIAGSSHATIQDMTMYAAAGMGVIGFQSDNLTFKRFQVRPHSGYVMSTNTDATHFISCTGEITFDDCYFEGMGDDAANVHGFYLSVKERVDPRTLIVTIDTSDITQNRRFDAPKSGDRLEFVHAEDLSVGTENVVRSVEVDERRWEAKLVLEEPLPEGMDPASLLIANASRTARLVFRNSTVTNNRARALLIQTRGAVVNDCLFDSCTGTAIHVNTASGWKESIGTQDVLIQGNTFRKCGFGAGTITGTSAIAVTTESERHTVGVHRRIRIVDNQIQGLGGKGILLSSASDIEVSNNSFEHCDPEVYIEHCEAVTCEDNRLVGQERLAARIVDGGAAG